MGTEGYETVNGTEGGGQDVLLDQEEELALYNFESQEQEYRELHEQIQASKVLLTTLSSFVSTFQTDLSSVSGEIKDLHNRSQDIERRGGGRRTISQPLTSLLASITIPPPLIHTILDTPVSETTKWIEAVEKLEEIMNEVERRKTRVKAAKEMEGVLSGLKVMAVQKIRAHILSSLTPMSTSISTNLPILQTASLLKMKPLYSFVSRQNPQIATEVRRSYIWRARGYYETGMRRYTRALGLIKARWKVYEGKIGDLKSSTVAASPVVEAATAAGGGHQHNGSLSIPASSILNRVSVAESITSIAAGEEDPEGALLAYARVEGEGVALAWQADEKDFKLPPEILFRSIMLVLMDNASAEYAFLVRFFGGNTSIPTSGTQTQDPSRANSRLGSVDEAAMSEAGVGAVPKGPIADFARRDSEWSRTGRGDVEDSEGVLVMTKEELMEMEVSWKMIFDPAMEYIQAFITSLSTPVPPLVSLLTQIRLNDAVLTELGTRGCAPLEGFCIKQRLALWPLFQKEMGLNIESLKKTADSAKAATGLFAGSSTKVKDGDVQKIAMRYTNLFNAIAILSSVSDENMLFSSLTSLRNELQRLIENHASSKPAKDVAMKEAFTSTIYDGIISALRVAFGHKQEVEIEFWEARRKSAS